MLIGSYVGKVEPKDEGDRALLVAVGQISSFAERISESFKGQDGEIALLSFSRILRTTSVKTWAK